MGIMTIENGAVSPASHTAKNRAKGIRPTIPFSMRAKASGAALGFILCLCLYCGCSRNRPPATADFMTMGTFASISLPADEAGNLPELSRQAQDCFSDLSTLLSIYNPTSDVSMLNTGAGIRPVAVSEHTLNTLRAAREYGALSGGLFDVTLLPVLSLWGFGPYARRQHGDSAIEPDQAEIEAARELVGYKHIVLNDNTAYLDRKGMKLDLGGIAKGYATDVLFDQLVKSGRRDVLVNIGGNLRCSGSPRKSGPWVIGVRDPFNTGKMEKFIGTLKLSDGMATATSGNYERYITINGRKYCHIINPVTGRPAEGMAGVTVICPTAMQADALSTTLFLLGVERGIELADKLPGVAAIFVPDRQPMEIFLSARAGQYFTPSK